MADIVRVLNRLQNRTARLPAVAAAFRSAQSAESSAYIQFARQKVPSTLAWMKARVDKMHKLFQLTTSNLAIAAAKNSPAYLDRGNDYLYQLDDLAKTFNQELAEYKENLNAEREQIDLALAYLSEKARAALKEGKPYSLARQILIADGWTPIDNRAELSPNDLEHNVVKNLKFYEMETCSGTGVGYCNFTWWKEKDGPLLTITTVGNDERQGGRPTVSGYRID